MLTRERNLSFDKSKNRKIRHDKQSAHEEAASRWLSLHLVGGKGGEGQSKKSTIIASEFVHESMGIVSIQRGLNCASISQLCRVP